MALISNVVTGGTIAASWGNAVRDATVQVTTSSARPSSPAEGMVIYETDTNRFMVWDGTAWVRFSWSKTSSRTGCSVRKTTNSGAMTSGSSYSTSFDTEDYDSDGFITVSSGTITIPTGLGGLYMVSYSAAVDKLASGNATPTLGCSIKANLSGTNWGYSGSSAGGNNSVNYSGTIYVSGMTVTIPMSAGDTLTFSTIQVSGVSTYTQAYARADVYRVGI